MENKSHDLTKLSTDQLYNLLYQKEISDLDRQNIKKELVKRNAGILFTQAQQVRISNIPQKQQRDRTVEQRTIHKSSISPGVWFFLIFLFFVLCFVFLLALNN